MFIYNNKKIVKYDDVNSRFYDGIISIIDISNDNVCVSLIDDIYFNK